MKTEKTFQEEANEAGERFLENIKELFLQVEHSQSCDGETTEDGEECEYRDIPDYHNEDDAQRQLDEYPLSILTRSRWHTPGSGPVADEEYEILLSTGGPALRIVGELNEYAEPVTARFEYQDWFKPWTRALMSGEDQDVLLRFARNFYFGG